MRTLSGLAVLAVALTTAACGTDGVSVKSPGGELIAAVTTTDEGLVMSVRRGGVEVLPDSPLGLILDGLDIGEGVSFAGRAERATIREEYSMFGNHSLAVNHCREVTIPLRSGTREYRLVVRAYDDGVAVRYAVPAAAGVTITADNTSFRPPAEAVCFWAPYTDGNEELHSVGTFADLPEGQAIVAPMTVKTQAGYMAFTEAACIDFSDLSWTRRGDRLVANFTANPEGWAADTEEIVSPWRAVIVADDLTGLVNSDLVANLNPPPAPDKNFSWAAPGRVLWQWWSVGAPKYEEQQAWYDAAARLTWEYYLVDDGWRDWRQPGKYQWQCLKDVVDYGRSVGVGSVVWVDSKEMHDRESVRAYLQKVKGVGAVGIKIDFIPRATPEIMRWYEMVREETYNLQLMCNFHGCVKPTGTHRTWPHEMTREGVRGNEWHITRYDRSMPLNQDEIVPFTRLLAGPADFTPVIFDERELRGYTRTHMLAQAVVYLSPLTHFADDYRNYVGSPVEDVLRDIPVVWDETRVLPCSETGGVAGFARRRGDEWWIGIMNGANSAEVSFALDFLDADARALIFADAEDGDPLAFARREQDVRPGEPITAKMPTGGGFVMVVKPRGALSGAMHPETQIRKVRERIARGEEPAAGLYRQLTRIADSLLDIPHHAVEDFSVPGFYQDMAGHRAASAALSGDAFAAYACALVWRLSDEKRYGEKACYLLDAWASVNKTYSEYDGSLVMAYNGSALLMAAGLMSGSEIWKEGGRFDDWVREVYRRAANEIRTKPNNWADWGRFGSLLAASLLDDADEVHTNIDLIKGDIESRIAPDGSMPEEVKREGNGLWYTYFSLAPMTASMWLVRNFTGEDMFASEREGALVKKALDYLLRYIRSPSEWPWFDNPRDGAGEHWPENLFAAMSGIYPDAAYKDFLAERQPAIHQYHHHAWTFSSLMSLNSR